jgi:hypothetical protein
LDIFAELAGKIGFACTWQPIEHEEERLGGNYLGHIL